MGSGSARHNLVNFFGERLWTLEPEAYGGMKGLGIRYLQILTIVIRNFRTNQCTLRATALSFTTILSLVPFCAFVFAILKGLGVHNRLEPLLLDQVAAGSQETIDRIVTYIDKTNMASLGAIGLLALVFTVISLFGTIEEAFNAIWGVRETRSAYRKFSDYLSVTVSGPLLLVAAISVTTTLQSQHVVQWLITRSYFGRALLLLFNLVPYLSIWLALVFLYTFIPNTKVRLKSAFVGGVLAGTGWQVAQWGYIHFQVGVAKYNAIYGTLSLLPIFMVWVYTSWLIVLAGVEVVHTHQNFRSMRHHRGEGPPSHRFREYLALAILHRIARAFHEGSPPLGAERLADVLDTPQFIVRELLLELAEAGYLREVAGDELSYLPSRDPEMIVIGEVLASLRNSGQGGRFTSAFNEEDVVGRTLAGIDTASTATLAGLTLKDLADSPVREASGRQKPANADSRDESPRR